MAAHGGPPESAGRRMTKFVPYSTRDGYLLHNIPGPLQRALAAEATQRGTSLTNVIGGALAARYELDFEPSSRPLKADFTGSSSFFVKLPPDLYEAVKREADERSATFRGILLVALSEAFGLEPPALEKINIARRSGRPHTKHGRPRGRKSQVK